MQRTSAYLAMSTIFAVIILPVGFESIFINFVCQPHPRRQTVLANIRYFLKQKTCQYGFMGFYNRYLRKYVHS